MLLQDFFNEPLKSDLTWNDLDVSMDTLSLIQEIEKWIKNSNALSQTFWIKSKIKPGYHALFYGPSGTGKTLTAALLGKYTNREVYHIDLSMVISKYIGETEKNLAELFTRASGKDWILFFDEADALFGKRTSVKDAHDKYANQEVSYLLQQIERYDGLVIVTTNSKPKLDSSILRLFDITIYFP